VIDVRAVEKNAVDSMRFSCESFSNEIDESDSQFEKQNEQRISTHRRIVIDLRPEEKNAFDSMRFSRESFSNEIDESDMQYEKHNEQRISILKEMITSASQPKYRINLKPDESTMKYEFPASIEIEIFKIFKNTEPSIKSTFRGITGCSSHSLASQYP
jgi:hypothetical protein